MGFSLAERVRDRAASLDVPVESDALAQLVEYLQLLERWNQAISLTALPLAGFPEATLDRLVMESLIAAGEIRDAPVSWFDLGSGGGTPAIPLKIVRPALQLTMVESRSRKCAFLREAVRVLGLAATDVLTSRYEDLGLRHTAELMTVRAVRLDAGLKATVHALATMRARLFLFSNIEARDADIPSFHCTRALPLPGPGSVLTIWDK
jgi:16S rRNA (guanine527-N7)-methyltransferase